MKYEVKPNDTLKDISFKFNTTEKALKYVNPTIVENNGIYGGEILKIPTVLETSDVTLMDLEKRISLMKEKEVEKFPTNTVIPDETMTVNWGGYAFTHKQLGIVYILRNTYIYRMDGKDKVKKDRMVKKNDAYRVYGETELNGGMFDVGGGQYVKKQDSYYMQLPKDKLKMLEELNSDKPGTSSVQKPNVKIPELPPPKQDPPLPIPSPTNFQHPGLMMPGYRRTRLQIKSNGKVTTHELRINTFTRVRGNEYSPSRTNAGWGIHVGGSSLTTLSVSGFFLDTLTNREKDDFDRLYRKHIMPKTDEKHFVSEVVTLIHKNIEYKGFITSDSVTDDSSMALLNSFQFNFLVLNERKLSSLDEQSKQFSIDRKGKGELEFFSDLSNMLKNPITGK